MRQPFDRMQVTLAVAVLSAGCLTSAWAASLNDTGEVRCVTEAGSVETSCAQSGQDAAVGRDVTAPGNKNGLAGFKFQKVCKNGDPAGKGDCPPEPLVGDLPTSWACTKDLVTGILWEMKAESGRRNYRVWYDLTNDFDENPHVDQHVADINGERLCGKSDWRLPNNLEVQSIVAYGQGDGISQPTMDGVYFPYSQINGLWTGTRPLRAENFLLDLQTGSLALHDASVARPVRLISAPIEKVSERFQVLSNNEVFDTATQLIWRRCAEGKVPRDENCGRAAATSFAFFSAISHAKGVAASTGLPWRVPNVKELLSITASPKENPAIKTRFFPGVGDVYGYWSSTPFIEAGKSTGKAWQLDPMDGSIGAGASEAALLLVRDADITRR